MVIIQWQLHNSIRNYPSVDLPRIMLMTNNKTNNKKRSYNFHLASFYLVNSFFSGKVKTRLASLSTVLIGI